MLARGIRGKIKADAALSGEFEVCQQKAAVGGWMVAQSALLALPSPSLAALFEWG